MAKETNSVIMIRDLKEEDLEAIEHIKKRFDIKANTKAITKILEEYMMLYYLCEDQKQKIEKLEDEVYQKDNDLQVIKRAFNIIGNIESKNY